MNANRRAPNVRQRTPRRLVAACLTLLAASAWCAEARRAPDQPIAFDVQPGGAHEIALDLGIDQRPGLSIRAEVLGPNPVAAGTEDLRITLAAGGPTGPGTVRGAALVLPGPPGHNLLLVRVEASPEAGPGRRRATLLLVDRTGEAGAPLRVPLVIDVAPPRRRLAFGWGPVSVGLAVLVLPLLAMLWAKSTFFDLGRLAPQITPLRQSTAGSGIEVDTRRKSQTRSLLTQHLAPWTRVRCWLASKPWRVLWSEEPHREMARITPNRHTFTVRTILPQPLDAADRLEPGIYAVATDRGKARLFLRTDTSGGLYHLRPETRFGPAGPAELVPITSPVRLVLGKDDDPVDGPVGWEVRP